MTANHLKLNLDKTELLFIPGKDLPSDGPTFTIEDIKVSPAPTARNLGVVLDDQDGRVARQLLLCAHLRRVDNPL